jgi:hypothetical protein
VSALQRPVGLDSANHCLFVWGSNPGGGEIFRTRPDRPWGPSSLLYNGHHVCFPGVKRPERGANQPSPFSAEVKEGVELYRYFLRGPSCHVVGRTETNLCVFIESYGTHTVVCVSVVHVKYRTRKCVWQCFVEWIAVVWSPLRECDFLLSCDIYILVGSVCLLRDIHVPINSMPIFFSNLKKRHVRRVCKISEMYCYLRRVCPSVCNSWTPTGRILMRFDTRVFENTYRENSSFLSNWQE